MIFSDVFPVNQETLKPAVLWSTPGTYAIPEGHIYGIPTGKRNGILVIDLDRKGGKDGLAELQRYMIDNDFEDLPDTYTVKTRNNGLHLYLKMPDSPEIGNRAGVLRGFDVRASGGFVYAGGPYTVIRDIPIAEAPEWLIELIASPKRPAIPAHAIAPIHPDWEVRCQQAANYIRSAPVCVAGEGGQSQIWKMGLHLMRTLELPLETVLQLLRGYNARCLPPWNEGELSRHMQRAAEEGTSIPGTFASDFLESPKKEGQLEKVPGEEFLTQESAGDKHALNPKSAGGWRRDRDPHHRYTWDIARDIQGSLQTNAMSQRDLTASLTGPGANPEWRGVWQYDEFRRKLIAVNPPLRLDAETTGLSSTDLACISMWYACNGMKVTIPQLENAIGAAGAGASFHPVRDYLDGLPATSPEAADAYFRGIAGRLWGATEERNELESAALRRLAIAAVRRVRRPGTKVDVMLVLAGRQGWNKSRFCAHLFAPYFRDSLPALESKESCQALEGMWGVEMAEMRNLTRQAEETKKEFLSRETDKYRPPYGRAFIEAPRQCVFIGTTNDDEFLSDPTGARRYDVCDVEQKIDLSFSRDEFWSAASALEQAGEPHWRTEEEIRTISEAEATEKARALEESRHMVEDPWTDLVRKYCAGKEQVKAPEALTYAIAMPIERQDARALRRVSGVLRRLYGPSKVRWIDGRAQRVYEPS